MLHLLVCLSWLKEKLGSNKASKNLKKKKAKQRNKKPNPKTQNICA